MSACQQVHRRTIDVCLLALCMSFAPIHLTAQGNIERQIRQNQERLSSIRRQRTGLQTDLEHLRGRVHNISSELTNIERQKTATSRIVNELDRQRWGLALQLDTITLDVVLAQDALAEKRAVLERRLTDIYKRGPLWTFQVMLAAESFGDLLSRYKYLYLVSRQDRALVTEVEELRDRMARHRQELLTVRAELRRSRGERGLELARYSRLESQRQRSLSRARASEQQTARRLEDLARDEDRLTDVIAELIRTRREAEARRDDVATIASSDIGTLDWPVEGPLVYQFGQYTGPNNTTLRRDGIGIKVPEGTPVRAVAAGEVRAAAPLGTYGLTVIIDHGGEFFTIYQSLSRLDVAADELVNRGQVIGLSGGTSESGSHLGFQLRQGLLRLDPLNWLRPRR